MLRILETETVSYLAYATARTENLLLGHLYQFALDVLLRRTPCFFLDEISEIIGRQVHPVSKIFHGRQPLRLRTPPLGNKHPTVLQILPECLCSPCSA